MIGRILTRAGGWFGLPRNGPTSTLGTLSLYFSNSVNKSENAPSIRAVVIDALNEKARERNSAITSSQDTICKLFNKEGFPIIPYPHTLETFGSWSRKRLKALAEALGLSIDGGNLEIKMRIAQNLGLDHGTIMDFLVCKTPKKGVVRNKKSAAKKSAVKKDDVETD